MKKTLLSVLCLALLLAFLTAAACADAGGDPALIASGEYGENGDNVTWALYDDGNLIISGSGAMRDYGSPYSNDSSKPRPPWFRSDLNPVKTVTI